jgi:geranylgeranylglycerol-phosphate geranylgeranyltransferase
MLLSLIAILRLTRPVLCLLGFLSIFLPFFVRTHELSLSFGRAIPVFLICMCTFIVNDLDDIEKDRVNHPKRPLPTGDVTPQIATFAYFISLGLALLTVRHYVPPRTAFWYYALIAVSISYGYLVDSLPSLKAPYVAAANTIPIIIVAVSYPNEGILQVVALSTFFHTLGREICMDIEDRAGDAVSLLHRFRPTPLAITAFLLASVGLLLLITQVRHLGDVAVLAAMASLLALAGVYWFKVEDYKHATATMKIQYFIGLYFLV